MALPSHVSVKAKMSMFREITRSETETAFFLTELTLMQCTCTPHWWKVGLKPGRRPITGRIARWRLQLRPALHPRVTAQTYTPIESSGGVRHAWRDHNYYVVSEVYILYFSTILSNDFISSYVRAIGRYIVFKNNRDRHRRYWHGHGGFRHERNLAQLNTNMKQSRKHTIQFQLTSFK